MRKKILLSFCVILILAGITGCGSSDNITDEESVITEEISDDVTEAEQEDEAENNDTENSEMAMEDNQKAAEQAGNNDALSDDLYSYQLLINGELYQIPMKVEELLEKGWVFDGDINEELDAYTFDGVKTFCIGDYDIEVDIVNETDHPQPYSSCSIAGISVNLYYNSGNDMTFIMPKEIQSNISTVEDVKAAYGEPTDFSETDGMAFVTYEVEYGVKYITLSFDKGKLVTVNIKNSDF